MRNSASAMTLLMRRRNFCEPEPACRVKDGSGAKARKHASVLARLLDVCIKSEPNAYLILGNKKVVSGGVGSQCNGGSRKPRW